MSVVQPNHPELLGAADRAGKVVREQVSAMAEAAQGTASEIDGRAREAGEATRQEALASATRVSEEIGRLEDELAQLRKFVGGEADGLRAKLDRSRLLHASRMRAEAPAALSGPAPVAERGALSPAPDTDAEDAPELAQAEDQDSVATPEPVAADAEVDGPDESEAPTPDLDETRAEIVRASDLGLAELYVLARARANGPFENEKDAAYWPAVVRAAVEEATTRPDFGQAAADDAQSGRKAKKQRARTLKPLVTARDEALGVGADESQPAAAGASADAPVEESADAPVEEPADAPVDEPPSEAAEEGPDEAKATDEAEDESANASDEGESPGLGGLRRTLSKAGRRRNRPFLDVAGQCAVCGKSFQADDESALADSGWLVNGKVGLCPEDQELGWELPEGRPVPYKRGGGD